MGLGLVSNIFFLGGWLQDYKNGTRSGGFVFFGGGGGGWAYRIKKNGTRSGGSYFVVGRGGVSEWESDPLLGGC